MLEEPHHRRLYPLTNIHLWSYPVVSISDHHNEGNVSENSNTSSIEQRIGSRVRALVCAACTAFDRKPGQKRPIRYFTGTSGGVFVVCGRMNTQLSKRPITISRRRRTETIFIDIPGTIETPSDEFPSSAQKYYSIRLVRIYNIVYFLGPSFVVEPQKKTRPWAWAWPPALNPNTMSLTFVPRSVAKKRDNAEATSSQVQGSVPLASSSARRPSIESGIDAGPATSPRSKKKEGKYHGEELAILLECALGNYALWLQPDLQRYAASAATEGCSHFLLFQFLLPATNTFRFRYVIGACPDRVIFNSAITFLVRATYIIFSSKSQGTWLRISSTAYETCY